MKDMEQRAKIFAMLKQIQTDIDCDMQNLDGQTFNGRNTAESIGKLAAGVYAVAAGLVNLLELEAIEHDA